MSYSALVRLPLKWDSYSIIQPCTGILGREELPFELHSESCCDVLKIAANILYFRSFLIPPHDIDESFVLYINPISTYSETLLKFDLFAFLPYTL